MERGASLLRFISLHSINPSRVISGIFPNQSAPWSGVTVLSPTTGGRTERMSVILHSANTLPPSLLTVSVYHRILSEGNNSACSHRSLSSYIPRFAHSPLQRSASRNSLIHASSSRTPKIISQVHPLLCFLSSHVCFLTAHPVSVSICPSVCVSLLITFYLCRCPPQ